MMSVAARVRLPRWRLPRSSVVKFTFDAPFLVPARCSSVCNEAKQLRHMAGENEVRDLRGSSALDISLHQICRGVGVAAR